MQAPVEGELTATKNKKESSFLESSTIIKLLY